MEKINVDNNEVNALLTKNYIDVNSQLNKIRNIFKNKFKSNANDRIDIFLEDDFIENLFNFIETQNDVLIKYQSFSNKLIRDLDTEKETFENKIKLNQDLYVMITNKLNEKIYLKEHELIGKNKEIDGLKIQIEKLSETLLNKEITIINNKSIDIELEKSEETNNKYEENCYHTFSIDDECFKSADAKLYVCSNDDKILIKDVPNIDNRMNVIPITRVSNLNSNKVTEERKLRTHVNYSHNHINNIYNNNYFNNKNHLQNFLSPIETAKAPNTVTNTTPQNSKNGFINNKEKDILPKYNRITSEKDNSKESLNNSINLENAQGFSGDKPSIMQNKIKEIKKKLTSNKAIQKVIYVSDSQQKNNEILKRHPSPLDGKKISTSPKISNNIPKHRRLLSSQVEIHKPLELIRDRDNSKDNSFSSSLNSNEKLTNPTQKLLNKYYEILANYNKKVKKEGNMSFCKDKKDLESSINEGHSINSCSTARGADKFINTNSQNFRSENKKRKSVSNKDIE